MKTFKRCNDIALSSIEHLKGGIDRCNKILILEAYDAIADDDFSWEGLDVPYMEWDDLLDEANDVLNDE
jgi:hypothetical protein